VRPIIHADFQGYKVTVVGSEVHFAKSIRTFPDFLKGYLANVLGPDWGQAEIAKPYEERHEILKWYDRMCRFQQKQKKNADGLYEAAPNGVMAAYLCLAYDLYVIRDNAALQKEVIRRLKHPGQFQSARYELFAAATCIRAGFEITYEDETDITRKHPEFIARHKDGGQEISVEAKSRHRSGVLGQPGELTTDNETTAGVRRLLVQAFEKPTTRPYIIFVDINLPPTPEPIPEKAWFDEIVKTVNRTVRRSDDGLEDFSMIIFTNHPDHYGADDEAVPKRDTLSVFSKGPRIPMQQPEVLMTLHKAALQYGNIPNAFDE
jgi:hypothetical protein